MDIDMVMEKYGFAPSLSGGGCEWYTKEINYKGRKALVAVTDNGGLGLPESLEEAVYVGIYDLDSGDETSKPVTKHLSREPAEQVLDFVFLIRLSVALIDTLEKKIE